MTIKYANMQDIPALRRLWKEVFEDTDGFLDNFFMTLFATDRCLCGWEDGKLVAMVFWMDQKWREHTIAYGYAVAVDQEYRGRGFCRKLLGSMRLRLRRRGYYGIMLVPSDYTKAEIYKRMGYKVATRMEHFMMPAAGEPDTSIKKITWQEYREYRAKVAPKDSTYPGDDVYYMLNTYQDFYISYTALFCGYMEVVDGAKHFHFEEYLGDPRSSFQVVRGLGCHYGTLPQPGGYAYGMFLNLTKDKEMPKYHCLSMG